MEEYRTRKAKSRMYHGKYVLNEEWYNADSIRKGDYVEESVLNILVNSATPILERGNCTQLSGVYDTRLDEEGNCKNTYTTFKKVASETWVYCGHCFYGETREHGEEIYL